jgi:hypothetical protein
MNTPRTWDYLTREVTDITEEEILHEVGDEGWELIDLGPMALHLRRPHDSALHTQWEYTRHDGNVTADERTLLMKRGWQPAAHSTVFHYFKRPRGVYLD